MSTNAVLCVTDGKHTARLSKYRCKPTLLLNQLAHMLASTADLSIGQVVDILTNNGFEQEDEISTAFKAADMQPGMMVNWAWLLDLDDMSLKYWDVTMPTSSFEETISHPAESPLEHLQWCGERERSEISGDFFSAESALKTLGIAITNFEQSEFYSER